MAHLPWEERMMTPEELKAEADANNRMWRCGTFDTKGKEALEYFKNLTYDPQDEIMTIEDMEKTIKFHEEELAAEDKRVEGTDEYPNYGDDFADMVYIARRLLDEIERLRERVRFLENRIGDASVMLADWDGYYNPTTKRGNAEELASLIEDAYCTLQGKSWREIDTDSDKENTNE